MNAAYDACKSENVSEAPVLRLVNSNESTESQGNLRRIVRFGRLLVRAVAGLFLKMLERDAVDERIEEMRRKYPMDKIV